MAGTETGWTSEWYKLPDGVYWWRLDADDTPDAVNVEDGLAEGKPINVYGGEFLGPISPSDFEQLTRLREAAEYSADVLDLAEAAMTAAAPYCARDLEIAIKERVVKVKNAISALREALAQRRTGEQS